MIEPQDLRTGVQRGLITEAQAAGLTALADARRQARQQVQPGEEPFVLFKGFNEIFIVVGLSVLFAGWMAMIWAMAEDLFDPSSPSLILTGMVTLLGLAALQRYFTLVRRMIAPSIALALMVAFTTSITAAALLDLTSLAPHSQTALSFAGVALVMLGHYRLFRVPFDAVLIALAGFSAVWLGLAGNGYLPEDGWSLLHLSGEGWPALLSLAFGAICFALAMRFDMSDPHRISTRATTGFWLHVVAAPAILNPIALHLLDQGVTGQLTLMVILAALACLALVIDRRSFLVSGVGYAVWLSFALFDGGALVILLLGLGLVLLGAQWERLRARLMAILPDFPGKDRLPPYGTRI